MASAENLIAILLISMYNTVIHKVTVFFTHYPKKQEENE